MIRVSETLGLPVVDEKNGDKIGNIKDIIYSKNRSKILAFLINEGNIFTHPKVISYKNIKFIGEDKVVIKDSMSVEDSRSIPKVNHALEENFSIVGDEVTTDNGEVLGIIHDIVFDSKNGKIMGFILTNGIYEDLKEGRSVMPYLRDFTFGMETMVIPREFKNQFDKNKETFKKLLELE